MNTKRRHVQTHSLQRGPFGARAMTVTCGLALACVLPSAAALAQQQQQPNDSGRLLERDLRVGGGGNTPKADFAKEVARRNALVTGNVGGSKSFRGNVGYGAPGDFRGALGSDSFFAFKRDSSSASGVSGRLTSGLRGVDSPRYSSGPSVGSGGGAEAVSRSGASGKAAAELSPSAGELADIRPGNQRIDVNTLLPRRGAARSIATYTSSAGLDESAVGVAQGAQGPTAIRASGLLGLRSSKPSAFPKYLPSASLSRDGQNDRDGASPADRTGLVKPVTQAINQNVYKDDTTNLHKDLNYKPTRTVYDALRERMDGALDGKGSADEKMPKYGIVITKVDENRKPIVDEAAKGGGANDPSSGLSVLGSKSSPTGGAPTVEERINKLRERLTTKQGRLFGEGGVDAKGRMTAGVDKQRAEDEAKLNQRGFEGIDPKTLAMIKNAGGQVDRFVDPTTGQLDEYAKDMALGQELLGKRKYFDAEERFVHALAIRPGEPTAMAARTHAQLGAGLYMSASHNMRQLFSKNPEVVGLRYTGETIPPSERLLSIAAELRGMLKDARDAGIAGSSEYGVLLAYLGYQLNDQAVVREGLESARRSEQAAVEAGQEGDALIELAEKIWLSGQADTEGSKSESP